MFGALIDDLAQVSTYSISATARTGGPPCPFQPAVLDQPAAPRGSRPRLAPIRADHCAGRRPSRRTSGVREIAVGHGVFSSRDARDDPDHRLIGAEAQRRFRLRSPRNPQFAGFRRLGRSQYRRRPVDSVGFREQPARLRSVESRNCSRSMSSGRMEPVAALKSSSSSRNTAILFRRRRGRFGSPGRGEPCKHYCRSEDEGDGSAWISPRTAHLEMVAISSDPRPSRNGSFPCVGRVKYPILRFHPSSRRNLLL